MQFNEKEKFFNIYCCKAAPFFVAGLTNYSLCGQKTGTHERGVRRRVFKYWPPNVMSFLFTFVSLKQLETKLIDFLTGIRTQIVEMNTLTSPIPFTFFFVIYGHFWRKLHIFHHLSKKTILKFVSHECVIFMEWAPGDNIGPNAKTDRAPLQIGPCLSTG